MSRGKLLLGLSAYVAIMIGIIWGLILVRNQTMKRLGTPEALAQWQEWREAAAKQSTEGPVRRRIPKGIEPPALILMRDHFPVMLGGSVFFVTVLFLLLGWIAQGAMRK